MKLFPANGTLEDLSTDSLSKLLSYQPGYTNLLVITDRLAKLTRAVPMKGTNAFQNARAFLTNWEFVYGITKKMLTNNGPQFKTKISAPGSESAGGYIFLRVEKQSEKKRSRRHKLAPIANGPYPAVNVKDHTFVFERRDKTLEEVSLDRVEGAPLPIRVTPESQREEAVPSDASESEVDAPNVFILERLMNYKQDPDAPDGHLLYLAQWFGYSERTWQPASELRRNMLVRFYNRRKLPMSWKMVKSA